jgi:hypothetical protein
MNNGLRTDHKGIDYDDLEDYPDRAYCPPPMYMPDIDEMQERMGPSFCPVNYNEVDEDTMLIRQRIQEILEESP